jgi:hypothetical protein
MTVNYAKNTVYLLIFHNLILWVSFGFIGYELASVFTNNESVK